MKSLGYLISTVSVVLLGLSAWLKPEQAGPKSTALLLGMATSILGMFLRYLSHRKEQAAIGFATREADREAGRGL